MTNEEKINLNNGSSVVKKFEKETFQNEFAKLRVNETGIGEVTITDENIKNNAKLVVNMFDES